MIELAARRILGASLALLGIVVIAGWLAQVPVLVQIVPGLPAMTLGTALWFLFSGAALLAPELASTHAQQLQEVLGGIVASFASLMLIERLTGFDLGIDWRSLHASLDERNAYPGRMSLNTSCAFLLIGATLALMHRARGTLGAILIRVLTLAIITIGGTAIVGYVLGEEFIYGWYGYSTMALHTAIGVTTAGVALVLRWRELPWYRERIAANPGEQIAMVGAVWLVVVAFTAGITGFLVMQQRAAQNLSDTLAVALHNRIQLFESLIVLRSTNATLISTRPAMIMHLRTLARIPDDANARAAVGVVAASFLPGGFSAVAIYDERGGEVARSGAFADRPAISVRLNAPNDAELIWEDGFVLRTRTPLKDDAGPVGAALAEQRLQFLTEAVDDVARLGETGDAGLCGLQAATQQCFPQRLRREAFTLPPTKSGGPLAISLALEGQTGVMRTVDYRGSRVIAAYGPVGDLGLGMTLKLDIAEVYKPVRERLGAFAPVLLALVVAGILVLRIQTTPLVSELVASREALRKRTVELQETNVELERAAKAKDSFLATMSHELRTPLNAILGFTGTLLMKLPGPLTQDQERQLSTIHSSGKHLLALINELLDLARIDSGKIGINPERIDCKQALHEVADALRPLAENKGLKLEFRFPEAEIVITSDRRALFQIAMNLVNNAIKYTRTGSVTIGLEQHEADGRMLTEISVTDTGIGIASEDQPKLFTAFSRVGESAERHESTGLGLYYSRRLAELIGGRIICHSEFGKGSTFILAL